MGIWLARVAAVWLLTGAWWECAYSTLSLKADTGCILGFLLLFSCVINFLCAKLYRRYAPLWILAGTTVFSAFFIVWNKKVFVSALNHIANAYIRYGTAKEQKLMLYQETSVSIMQRSIAIAVMLLPLVMIFSVVLWYGRGKAGTALLCIILPLALAVKSGFPDSYACWMLLLAAGIYFSIIGIQKDREVWIRAAAAAGVLTLLMAISIGAGARLNHAKTEHEHGYYGVRKTMQKQIIDRVVNWINPEEAAKQEEQKKKQQEEKKDQEEKENQEEPTPDMEQQENSAEESPATLPWEGASVHSSWGEESYGDLHDLSNVARFSPNDAVNTVIKRTEKPDSTVYEPLWYGGLYAGSMWSRFMVTEQVYDEYSQVPYDTNRLISLCQDNPCRTPGEADAFITKEFEENTIYDYEPGRPPKGIDFAEYFLFDNKKGFCVHFATTAALMYRIYGIPARYAEGYAIPADAFKKQEDGTYAAQVTGEMGHAWCEIYDGAWIIKEHTLPYRGPDREGKGPAFDTRKTKLESSTGKMLIRAAAVFAVICMAVVVFFIQAAIRRSRRRRSLRRASREVGIQLLYANIYETTVFLGMDKNEPLTARTAEDMSAYYSNITKEELLWMKEQIQEVLFRNKVLSKEEFDNACQIHGKFTKQVKEQLTGHEKVKYRYVRCLDSKVSLRDFRAPV